MFDWHILGDLFEQNQYMAVIYIDKNGIIKYLNDTYLKILDLKREQVVGKHILDITPHSRAYITLQTGKAKVGYEWIVNKHCTLGTALPIFGNGEIVGVFGYTIFLDIWDGKDILDEVLASLDLYKDEVTRIHRACYSFEDIRYKSQIMREIIELGNNVASHPFTTVLITGESGTGKELFAHAIHNASKRCKKPFVRVNCAAIPENLLESELFGYEEGAYTGAKKGGKLGKFELADKGTIFLDEIAEIPLSMQSKLLYVLQEQVIERLGSLDPIRINVRVIAATNRDLNKMVDEGLFRRDLFYRLNVVNIEIPPLRDRLIDIRCIAQYIIRKLNSRLNMPEVTIDDKALQLLCKYNWPGNVRELENVLERSLIIAEMDKGGTLLAEHISIKDKASELNGSSGKKVLKDIMNDYEESVLVKALKKCHFDVPVTAKLLGIDASSMYRKLKKHDITLDRGLRIK